MVRALRRTACRITLVDRSNHTLFQPLLYQVATAALSPADIALPIRSVLRGQANVATRLAEVTGIDSVTREIVLRKGASPSIISCLRPALGTVISARDSGQHTLPV